MKTFVVSISLILTCLTWSAGATGPSIRQLTSADLFCQPEAEHIALEYTESHFPQVMAHIVSDQIFPVGAHADRFHISVGSDNPTLSPVYDIVIQQNTCTVESINPLSAGVAMTLVTPVTPVQRQFTIDVLQSEVMITDVVRSLDPDYIAASGGGNAIGAKFSWMLNSLDAAIKAGDCMISKIKNDLIVTNTSGHTCLWSYRDAVVNDIDNPNMWMRSISYSTTDAHSIDATDISSISLQLPHVSDSSGGVSYQGQGQITSGSLGVLPIKITGQSSATGSSQLVMDITFSDGVVSFAVKQNPNPTYTLNGDSLNPVEVDYISIPELQPRLKANGFRRY